MNRQETIGRFIEGYAQTISTYYAVFVLLSITAYFLYEFDLMYTREYEEEYRNRD